MRKLLQGGKTLYQRKPNFSSFLQPGRNKNPDKIIQCPYFLPITAQLIKTPDKFVNLPVATPKPVFQSSFLVGDQSKDNYMIHQDKIFSAKQFLQSKSMLTTLKFSFCTLKPERKDVKKDQKESGETEQMSYQIKLLKKIISFSSEKDRVSCFYAFQINRLLIGIVIKQNIIDGLFTFGNLLLIGICGICAFIDDKFPNFCKCQSKTFDLMMKYYPFKRKKSVFTQFSEIKAYFKYNQQKVLEEIAKLTLILINDGNNMKRVKRSFEGRNGNILEIETQGMSQAKVDALMIRKLFVSIYCDYDKIFKQVGQSFLKIRSEEQSKKK